MQDLTQYSYDELSLIVFNDESFYNMRHDSGLVDTLGDYYVYSSEQLAVLIQDLQDDKGE